MSFYIKFVILITKSIAAIIKLLGLGSGATWPGEIALRLYPSILKTFRNQLKGNKQIIFIAGTNGKTTTAKMLETILHRNNKRVARNASGANLDNGIVSTFITHSSVFGNLRKDIFIFEIDEATVPHVVQVCPPNMLILLNLFRDQLDRYGEVDIIAEKWLTAIKGLQHTQFIVNGDDPHLAFIGGEISKATSKVQKMMHGVEKDDRVIYFGLNDEDLFLSSMQHATDSIFCPNCGNRLTFGGVYFSHLGKYACGQCGFTHPKLSLSAKHVTTPLPGVYNIYNVIAATLTAKSLGILESESEEAIKHFTPAFGRMEKVTYKGKRVQILLSKNPTGFNESLRTILHSQIKGSILMVLNDKIPDGKDISWIYDVDFEVLKQFQETTIWISGDRCFDLANRLHYAGMSKQQIMVKASLEEAINGSIQSLGENEQLWILPTYSAMLETRKIIVGRKIL